LSTDPGNFQEIYCFLQSLAKSAMLFWRGKAISPDALEVDTGVAFVPLL
jgi:hypothetical protein